MSAEGIAWSDAIALYQTHGDRIYTMVEKRLEAMATTGDAGGAEQRRMIAAKLDQLLRAATSQ